MPASLECNPEEDDHIPGGGMVDDPPRETERKALTKHAAQPGSAENAAGMDSKDAATTTPDPEKETGD